MSGSERERIREREWWQLYEYIWGIRACFEGGNDYVTKPERVYEYTRVWVCGEPREICCTDAEGEGGDVDVDVVVVVVRASDVSDKCSCSVVVVIVFNGVEGENCRSNSRAGRVSA